MQRRQGRKRRRRDDEEEDERSSKRGKEEVDEDDDMSDELDEYDTEYSSHKPWSEEEDARVRLNAFWLATLGLCRLTLCAASFFFCVAFFFSLTCLPFVLLFISLPCCS